MDRRRLFDLARKSTHGGGWRRLVASGAPRVVGYDSPHHTGSNPSLMCRDLVEILPRGSPFQMGMNMLQSDELAWQLAQVLCGWMIAVAPGVLYCWRQFAERPAIERVALGTAAGTAFVVLGAYWVGSISLRLVLGWFCAGCVVVLERLIRGRWSERIGIASEPRSVRGRVRSSAWTTLIVVICCSVHLFGTRFSILPQGVDSSFHCTVAQHLLDIGHTTTDMAPVERLRLNYPLGSHLLVALTSRVTGLEIHESFRHLFVVSLLGGALTTAAWTRHLFGAGAAGWGALTFLFAAYEASLYPYTWGGLPSALGMWFAVTAFGAMFWLTGFAAMAVAAALLGAMTLVHHHTWVSVYAGVLAAIVAQRWCGARLPVRPIAVALLGGAALAAIYVVPLLLRAGTLGETSVGSYWEAFDWPWVHLQRWGLPLLLLGLCGLFLVRDPARRPARAFLGWVMLAWLLAFAALNYGWRICSRAWTGSETTPFTPSRFLFDVQYVLAIFAGGGLSARWMSVTRGGGRLANWARRWFQLAATSAMVLVAGAELVPRWTAESWEMLQDRGRWRQLFVNRPPFRAVRQDLFAPAARWAREHLPADALIVTATGQDWLAYLCRREATYWFIPISEARPEYVALKQSLSTTDRIDSWARWSERFGGRPLYALVPATSPPSGALVLYSGGIVSVCKLE